MIRNIASRNSSPNRSAAASRLLVPVLLVVAFVLAPGATAQTTRTGPSGLPLPRFVSLKSNEVNVRVGPSRDHDIAWTFVKEGLPVEIIQEFDNWRRIRDIDGDDGWIFYKLLSGHRTALVDPKTTSDNIGVFEADSRQSRQLAWLEPRVLVTVSECDGTWCRVSVERVTGWVEQDKLYGVYADEKF